MEVDLDEHAVKQQVLELLFTAEVVVGRARDDPGVDSLIHFGG